MLACFCRVPAAQAADAAAQLNALAEAVVNIPAPAPASEPAGFPALARQAAQENTAAGIAGRCAPPSAGEPVIYQSDFRWDYTLPELNARFLEMYRSPKRLDKRAYLDAAGGLRLPFRDNETVKIDDAFIRAVERHIERALELGYIDGVFFPDMGHSHILIPEKLWETKYRDYPVDRMAEQYQDMFKDARLQIFYHTAEQLKTRGADGQLVTDERTRLRYRTRNIAGFIAPGADLAVFQNPESSANTVREVPGQYWWGAGFNLSAQQDGCFVYHSGGRTYRFDISLSDLPPDPAAQDGYDN